MNNTKIFLACNMLALSALPLHGMETSLSRSSETASSIEASKSSDKESSTQSFIPKAKEASLDKRSEKALMTALVVFGCTLIALTKNREQTGLDFSQTRDTLEAMGSLLTKTFAESTRESETEELMAELSSIGVFPREVARMSLPEENTEQAYVITTLEEIKKETQDVRSIIEKADSLLDLRQTSDWTNHILAITHHTVQEISTYSEFDIACLLSRDGRLDAWIKEYLSQLDSDERAAIVNTCIGEYTPLLAVAQAGSVSTLQILSAEENKLDLFRTNANGDSVLIAASSSGYVEMVEYLLSLLETACANERFKELLNTRNKDGYTPLLHAIAANSVIIAQMLLDKGAHVESHDDPEPVLYRAIMLANAELVELLLERKADPNVTHNGMSMLRTAIIYLGEGNESHMITSDYGKKKQQDARRIVDLLLHNERTNILNEKSSAGSSFTSAESYSLYDILEDLEKRHEQASK